MENDLQRQLCRGMKNKSPHRDSYSLETCGGILGTTSIIIQRIPQEVLFCDKNGPLSFLLDIHTIIRIRAGEVKEVIYITAHN